MICPSCGGELSPSHRFCPSCGTPASSLSQAPTAEAESPAAPAAAAIVAPVGRLISSDSLPVGGFTPGMVLADRYRIIGLIGRGGMGEVYRADDLKLGQPVALKFLPKTLAADPVRRERFFAEVRIARQVSHPNICRVYDISELEGRHFLTMEYIDGEDLASLLKRIGSLHGTKAIDIAKQLCAGLAAAHDKGVLHRDLKPANVMIDGRGRVRITDFGLAVAAGEEAPESDVSGTPPYMAPEQFAGKGASVRSDIYALGLVFYEIFTGKRAFEAKTLAELRAKKETSTPTAPSEIARDIDPIVERVILRCIEKDPRQRPASAAQVAAALPGGDPLAAALAAGETPSPEMVAASGSTEGLKPWIAWLCMAVIILGIFGCEFLNRQTQLIRRVPVTKDPGALVQIARQILKSAGYSEPDVDSAFGFYINDSYFNNVKNKDRSPHRFENLPSYAGLFWYRQAPRSLMRRQPFMSDIQKDKGISLTDPPFDSGEAVVWLDLSGSLMGLQVNPVEAKRPYPAQMTDWSALFKASGLDQTKFNSVQPDSIPHVYSYLREAWTETQPDNGGNSIRIEAASFMGKPVSWRLIMPHWDGPSIPAWQLPHPNELNFYIILVIGAAFIARRNLRMGRGDKRGAARLAGIIFVLSVIEWFFGEHHILKVDLIRFVVSACAWLSLVGYSWVMYIALEPYVRRRWTRWMVGWNRLLAGNYRDPLVGRDMLVGCVGGVVFFLLCGLYGSITLWFGFPEFIKDDYTNTLYLCSGPGAMASYVAHLLRQGLIDPLSNSFMIFVLLIPFRGKWRGKWAVATALIVLVLVRNVLLPYLSHHLDPQRVFFLLMFVLMALFLLRFGLLARAAFGIVVSILSDFPITLQRAWYAEIGFTGVVLLLALALYAFYTSLGGQPLFGRVSLED
jgi:hypothetical protein